MNNDHPSGYHFQTRDLEGDDQVIPTWVWPLALAIIFLVLVVRT